MKNYKKLFIGIILLFTLVVCFSGGTYATTAKLTGSDVTLNAGESTTISVNVKDPDDNPLKNKLVTLYIGNGIELFDRQWDDTDNSGVVKFKITAPKESGQYKLSYELNVLFETDGTSKYAGSKGSNTLTVKQTKTEITDTSTEKIIDLGYLGDSLKKIGYLEKSSEPANNAEKKESKQTNDRTSWDVTLTLPYNKIATSYGKYNGPIYISLMNIRADLITRNYKRINTIKLTTSNGYSVIYKNGVNFKDKKMKTGYSISLVMYQYNFF